MSIIQALKYRYSGAPITPGWAYRLDPFFYLYRWVQRRRYARMTPAMQTIEDLIPMISALCELSLVLKLMASKDWEAWKLESGDRLRQQEPSQNGVFCEEPRGEAP